MNYKALIKTLLTLIMMVGAPFLIGQALPFEEAVSNPFRYVAGVTVCLLVILAFIISYVIYEIFN